MSLAGYQEGRVGSSVGRLVMNTAKRIGYVGVQVELMADMVIEASASGFKKISIATGVDDSATLT